MFGVLSVPFLSVMLSPMPGSVPPFQSQLVELEQPKSYPLKNHDIIQIRRIPFWGNPRTVTIHG